MIAKREEDIKNFKPVPYYGLRAAVDGMTLSWQDKKTKQSTDVQRICDVAACTSAARQTSRDRRLKKTAKKSFAPGPL